MSTRKNTTAARILAALALCLAALAVCLRIPVYASRSNQGTLTDKNEWMSLEAQTTRNLITITRGSLTEQGWNNIGDQIHSEGLDYNDPGVDLKTPEYGYGIQAQNSSDDIGNKSYENGVWYRITLSEADRVKADKGDLTVSATSLNYRQTAATHYVSLKLFFDDASGKQLGSEEQKKKIDESAYWLKITDCAVPKGTASIRYYVSNWGSLAGRPFIGGMSCTLTDKTKPAVQKITLDKSGLGDAAGNVALAGDTLRYYLEFDEKVSVSSYGTAKLALDGAATGISGTGSLVTENGKSKICYTFPLPETGKSGLLSLASVTGLSVKDEAGNVCTYDNSAVSSDSVQYYKQMTVSSQLEHLLLSGGANATYGQDYTATLRAYKGYNLPGSVTVKVGASPLATAGYTYDSTTGRITIRGAYIKGDVEITAAGVAKKSTLTFDMQGGSGGTLSATGTYDNPLPMITVPGLTGYTFRGYYTRPDGQGTKYYDEYGVSMKYCDFDTATTLYAYWTSNPYTVRYEKNKPSGASGSVTGTMDDSSYTYDETKPLSGNGYKLTGWTFRGWATTPGGAVAYEDRQSVGNLSATAGATVTLYAVWTANTYTVEYDSNKPVGAGGTLTGATGRTVHTYDTPAALAENGYALKGWTFLGWSRDQNATEAEYRGGKSVSNLTAGAGGTVRLYAVWRANTYRIIYDANRPAGASGTVSGSMAAAKHVYDKAASLAGNRFKLVGWTFLGWSQNPNAAAADLTDGAEVLNLTDTDGAAVTLYAVWKANTYSITFDTEGGSTAETISATYDGTLPALAPPTRKGYNFNGYYTGRDGSGTAYYDADGNALTGYTVAGNTALYAYWTPICYNIELYSRGKYVGIIENVIFGAMRLPSALRLGISRDNYDFVGWNLYDDQNWAMYNADTDYGAGIAGAEGETVILYAAWAERPIYTISFDANGGIGAPAMAQAHRDETVTLSGLVPYRKNYTFLGWATEADATTARYAPGDTFTMGEAVVTFYAVWKHNPSLSYDASGGAFAVPAGVQYPAAGETVTLTDLVPARTGYVFLGWSREKDAAAAEYAPGQEMTMPDGDTVLWAVWQKAKHTVTVSLGEGYSVTGLRGSYDFGETVSFAVTGDRPKVYVNGQRLSPDENGLYSFTIEGDAVILVADGSRLSLVYAGNGGTDAPTDDTSYGTDASATVSAARPERRGYTFLGWATDANAESAEFTAGQTLTFAEEDVILYAVWSANIYTVLYRSGGGEGDMPADTFRFGTKGTLSANAFRRAGHTFLGWALSENGEVVYGDCAAVSDLCTRDGDSITLYAVWQRTVTVITFLTEDGTEYNAPLSVAYGEMLSSDGLMRPVRRGYLFAGYRTERDGLGELIFDADLHAVSSGAWDKNVSDLTLYACWIPVSYTVVYINGQKEAGRQSAVYGRPFDLLGAGPLGIIAPVGYHFAGWSTVPAGQTAVYADGQTIAEALTTADGDTVFLYAAFAPDQRFSVIYHPNGGSNAPVDPDKYFAGDSVPFGSAIPTRDGYIFAGWSYGTDGSVDFPYRDGRFTPASVTMQDGGLTLYAVWILNGKTLQEQIDEISGTNASLAGAINDLKNADTGFSGELSALKEQMQAAQDLLDSLGDTYVTKTELAGKVTELKNLLTQAQTDLTGKINQVQANLEAAVKELNETIKGNQEGVEARLDALEQARADADILLAKLQAEDSALGEKLTALEKTRKETDDKLLAMINGVKADLEAAVNRLNETIADNKDDMESRLADAERASANADALLRSDLTALAESNAALEERIAALENAVDTAHKTIWAGIERVQDDLDATRRRLEKSDRNLEKMIYDLQAESEKNAIACTVAVIMAVVTLIVTVGVAIYAAGKNRRDYR